MIVVKGYKLMLIKTTESKVNILLPTVEVIQQLVQNYLNVQPR